MTRPQCDTPLACLVLFVTMEISQTLSHSPPHPPPPHTPKPSMDEVDNEDVSSG